MQTLEKRKLNTVMSNFVAECRNVFNEILYDVRLFGSYARGEQNEESDIDIIVILDMSTDEIRKYRHDICRIAAALELKYNVTISPVLYGKEEYDTRKTFGFCKNVETEGVSKYAG